MVDGSMCLVVRKAMATYTSGAIYIQNIYLATPG